MSDVQFEDEDVMLAETSKVDNGEAKGLMKLAMHLGAKNETQASYVLIGIMVACLIAPMYVISRYVLS